MRNRKVLIGFVGLLILLGCTQALLDKQTSQGELVNAPAFEVDPLWPKPLPNHWLLGMAHHSGRNPGKDVLELVVRKRCVLRSAQCGENIRGRSPTLRMPDESEIDPSR